MASAPVVAVVERLEVAAAVALGNYHRNYKVEAADARHCDCSRSRNTAAVEAPQEDPDALLRSNSVTKQPLAPAVQLGTEEPTPQAAVPVRPF